MHNYFLRLAELEGAEALEAAKALRRKLVGRDQEADPLDEDSRLLNETISEGKQ